MVIDSSNGERNVKHVIHRADVNAHEAYTPIKQLQTAIYGCVGLFLVLKRHTGVEANDAASKLAGGEAGRQPIVWQTTNEYVAIKMVEWRQVNQNRGRLLEDPVKEAAAMQFIGNENPHLLGVRDILSDDNHLMMVMRYCPREFFDVVVAAGDNGMPEATAKFWFRQILAGLLHLQSVGVCHRDLSLENVLVDNDDNCLIIDMGMCLRVPYNDPNSSGNLTDARRGSIRRLMTPQGTCGKAQYMSPEVFLNREAFDGFAIDLWAAGVMLYIMLTGFPAYDHAQVADDRFQIIVSGQLREQIRAWGIVISDEVGDLLQSMLRLDPADRLTLAEVFSHPWMVN